MPTVRQTQDAAPKLRFLGFNEPWKSVTLGQLGTFLGGGTPSRAVAEYWLGTIPWISSSDVSENDIHSISVGRFITHEAMAASATKLVPAGSVLFVSRVGTGKIAVNSVPLCTSQDFTNFLPKEVNGVFVAYAFQARPEALQVLGQGTSIKGFSKADIEQFALQVPQAEEQQKIVDCLSSIYVSIGAGTRKLDALKALKHGLMQQLFPAEGQRLPHLRFPGFDGEWKETKAGSLFSNRVEAGEQGLPIYAVTMYDGMVLRSSIERRVDDIADAKGNRKVRKGDIAYNMMRMWQGACGVAAEDCMVSPAYVILAAKSGVCSDFFGYLLKLPSTLRQLTSHSQGLTLDRLRLYYKDFATIPMLCPIIEEQQKIATCLSSIDTLIAAQTRKIAALQQHKKGLMQGLFPVLDARVA